MDRKLISVKLAVELVEAEIAATTWERCFFCNEKLGRQVEQREGDALETVGVYRVIATHDVFDDMELGLSHILCGDARLAEAR